MEVWEPVLSLDDMRQLVAAEHPDWGEEQVLMTAVRLTAFDQRSRNERENNDRQFFGHTLQLYEGNTDSSAARNRRRRRM